MGRSDWTRNIAATALAMGSLLGTASTAWAQQGAGVRGVIPKAKAPITLDGKLDEWRGDFTTPINFGHSDWSERAGVWRYLWDENNLYIGLECLDSAPYNKNVPGRLFDGDAIEFYLDVRGGADLGAKDYAPGTAHLHFTPLTDSELKPRVQVRGGVPGLRGLTAEGMELAAAKTPTGWSLEFRLPWSKFPGFKPEAGREIGIDCELCSSDGGPRVDRCWVYSSATAVATPSAFGRVRLVDTWDPAGDNAAYMDVLAQHFLARSTPLGEPALLTLGIAPSLQPLLRQVQVTVQGRNLPMTVQKKIGPGWLRVQTCLVGFTRPEDSTLEVRLLGEGGKVLGTKTIPLK